MNRGSDQVGFSMEVRSPRRRAWLLWSRGVSTVVLGLLTWATWAKGGAGAGISEAVFSSGVVFVLAGTAWELSKRVLDGLVLQTFLFAFAAGSLVLPIAVQLGSSRASAGYVGAAILGAVVAGCIRLKVAVGEAKEQRRKASREYRAKR